MNDSAAVVAQPTWGDPVAAELPLAWPEAACPYFLVQVYSFDFCNFGTQFRNGFVPCAHD